MLVHLIRRRAPLGYSGRLVGLNARAAWFTLLDATPSTEQSADGRIPINEANSKMNTVQERIHHWRVSVKRMSLREFRDVVNARLSETARVSLGTISNYERTPSPGSASRGGPRSDFIMALKTAFPELRLDWLLCGAGEPTELAQRLAAPGGLESEGADRGAGGERGAASFAERVLRRYPDLELLAPEASALFMGALTRYAMGEPKMELDEAHLLELAGDLRWLLLLPLQLWGFRRSPGYDELSDYAVAQLHALMQLMPPTGRGDRIRSYEKSLGPRLRGSFPASLGS